MGPDDFPPLSIGWDMFSRSMKGMLKLKLGDIPCLPYQRVLGFPAEFVMDSRSLL